MLKPFNDKGRILLTIHGSIRLLAKQRNDNLWLIFHDPYATTKGNTEGLYCFLKKGKRKEKKASILVW